MFSFSIIILKLIFLEVINLALSILLIMIILITLLSISGVIFLLKTNNLIMFFLLEILNVLISYMHITSLPSNYLLERTICYILIFLGLILIPLKIKNQNKYNLSISILLLFSLIYFIIF
jgi:hypothetical protein